MQNETPRYIYIYKNLNTTLSNTLMEEENANMCQGVKMCQEYDFNGQWVKFLTDSWAMIKRHC